MYNTVKWWLNSEDRKENGGRTSKLVLEKKIKHYTSNNKTPEIRRTGRALTTYLLYGKTSKTKESSKSQRQHI